MSVYFAKNEISGVITGVASLCASLVAGIACIAPFSAIALGLGSVGWMTQYSYLTAPACVLSLALLAIAAYLFLNRSASCASKRQYFMKRNFLITTALFVVAINVTEFLIIPNLS